MLLRDWWLIEMKVMLDNNIAIYFEVIGYKVLFLWFTWKWGNYFEFNSCWIFDSFLLWLKLKVCKKSYELNLRFIENLSGFPSYIIEDMKRKVIWIIDVLLDIGVKLTLQLLNDRLKAITFFD